MRKMFLLPAIAVSVWAVDLPAQTQFRTVTVPRIVTPTISRPVTPTISKPVVVSTHPAAIKPILHNALPVQPRSNKIITIQLQHLTPAQSRAIENAARRNNVIIYSPPTLTVEDQADHVARLQAVIQAGAQGASVQPGTGLGYSGPVVSEVQTALRRLGYYHGQVDGLFGSSTQEALQTYQVARHRAATGLLDQNTLSALGVSSR
jgi:hypothetical protein